MVSSIPSDCLDLILSRDLRHISPNVSHLQEMNERSKSTCGGKSTVVFLEDTRETEESKSQESLSSDVKESKPSELKSSQDSEVRPRASGPQCFKQGFAG